MFRVTPTASGELLGTLYDYRWEADYGAGLPAVDLQALSVEVDGFIERMAELIDDPRNES